jgi:tetratricopeptide (TPR) repeat protein
MRSLLLLLVVLANAFVGSPALADCKLEKVADLPVTMAGLRPTVVARINGVDARFVVDSGAFFSSLTPAAVARYGLSQGPAPFNMRVSGIGGGEADISAANAKDFEFGGIPHKNADFLVIDTVGGGGTAGVIGQNVLGALDVEYDLANGVIRLFHPDGCGGASLAYWAKPDEAYSVIDIERTTPMDPNAKAHASINGGGIIVEFDTGMPHSMLSRAAAGRAGVTPTSPGTITAGYISGVAQRSFLETWRGTFASFKIGDEEIRNTPLLFGSIDLEDADMLIGTDFFLSHHIYVANSQHKLYFTYNGGPVFNLDAPNRPPALPPPVGDAVAGGSPGPSAGDEDATPHDADGYGRLATAFAARRDLPDAIADLNHAVELAPADPRFVYRRGLAEFANRQPLLAMADFDRALKLKPDDINALLARARLYSVMKRAVEARSDLDAADQFAAKNPDARLVIAEAYARIGDSKDVVGELDQWIAAHPKDDAMAGALDLRCRSRAILGQELDKALADCNAALRITPDAPGFLVSRGLVRLRSGDLDRAISDDDGALKLTPNDPMALYGRGLAKVRKGQAADGQADIAAAVPLNPRLPDEAKAMGLAGPVPPTSP